MKAKYYLFSKDIYNIDKNSFIKVMIRVLRLTFQNIKSKLWSKN